MKITVILIFAFMLDLIFGDPYWMPHPICLIGNMIGFTEKIFRKIFKNEFLGGMLLCFIILIVSFGIPFSALFFIYKINFYLGFAVETFFCYQILAAKSLKKESMKVFLPLVRGDLSKAKKYLSFIVGRDTQDLKEKGIIKATVETIAENTTDGVIAPMIFMAVGGAPLAFLYKAINTMDSMIGYRNKKYFYFGKFAARLDDAANFIPARISAVLMIFAAGITRLDIKNSIKIYIRDRKKHKSPNSAQTESVCAGALNVQLAGDAYYFGQLVHKPTIGDDNREIIPEDIILANRLMYGTAVLGVAIIVLIRGALWLI